MECPHCRSVQLESVHARTTICRSCGQHIDLDRPKQVEAAPPRGGLFKKVGDFFAREKIRNIRCLSCGKPQQLSTSARSSICQHCGTYIDLRDFKITAGYSRAIQTQGTVILAPKGDLTSTRIACASAQIQGRLRGDLFCTGIAAFKLKGRVYGAVDAQHLVVEKNSHVEFVRPVKVITAEIKGRASGRITAAGVVTVGKSGALEGVVYAKAISVDKGGLFQGELYIGSHELQQQELLQVDAQDQTDQTVGPAG